MYTAVVGERRAFRLVDGLGLGWCIPTCGGVGLGLDVCLCLGSLVEKEEEEGGW